MRLSPRSLAKHALAASACVIVAGCGDRGELAGVTRSAIVGGQIDSRAADAAIVALRRGDEELCTGSLVASNLVLTARRCVSPVVSEVVDCDERGTSRSGSRFGADVPAASVHVYLDPKPDLRGEPAARGAQILYPRGDAPCDADIALVILDRALEVTPLAVRRFRPVTADELVGVAGYGRTEDGASGVRYRRDDVRVLAVGPKGRASGTALGPRELELSQAFCEGDTGGPALSRDGAVVAVAARGPRQCADPAGYVFTQTASFKDLLDDAFRAAGATPRSEPGDVAGGSGGRGDGGATAGGGRADPGGEGAAGAPERRSTTSEGRPALGKGLPARCGAASALPDASGCGVGDAAFALAAAASLLRRRRRG